MSDNFTNSSAAVAGAPLNEARPHSVLGSLWSLGLLLPLAAFGVLWLDLIRQLSYTWQAKEQYAYGWFVPVFALGLFLLKWPSRPQASGFKCHSPSLASALICLLCLLLLPLRVILEINQDWPLITWPYAAIVVTLTLYALQLAGGWSRVRHFGFPVGFIFFAIAWPHRIEHGLTQGLMRSVSALAVEMLGWLGIPALQRGNLIELATGVVGVNEACSGIRSFQSTLMAALFLGELNLLRWPVRLLFLVLGLGLAFILNVGRAFFLAWRASTGGTGAIEIWHDPAGFTIVLICFVCLWLLALFLKRGKLEPQEHGTHISAGGEKVAGSTGPSCSDASSLRTHPLSPARRFLLAAGCWALVSIGATQAWYRWQTPRPASIARWSVALPVAKSSFRELTLSRKTLSALECNVSQGGSWTETDGAQWSLWFLGWRSQSIKSLIAARCHRPESCLPASGLRLQTDHGLRWYPAGDLQLPFRTYTFGNGGMAWHVFFCLWQDGTEQFTVRNQLGVSGRLWAAARGKRMLGQQTLEIVVEQQGAFEDAEQVVRERLPTLIRIENPPGIGLTRHAD